MDEQRLQEIAAAPVVEPPYDPSCVECRRSAGKDVAGTTWQCVGHVYRERDALRAEVRRLREQSSRWEAAYLSECRGRAKDFDEFCRLRQERDAALVERDALLVRVDQWRQMADREATAHVEMRAERDEARAALDGWVQWASSSRCIYCGQEFTHDPHDQEAADEPKKAHILICEAHPLRAALAEITRLRQERE